MASIKTLNPPESSLICKCCGKKIKRRAIKTIKMKQTISLNPPESLGICPCCNQKL